MSILEALWFDNLVVQDAEIRKGSEQEKTLAASVRCEHALRETLTEKQKEQSALCGERRNEVLTLFEKEAFLHNQSIPLSFLWQR